jgi:predicted short-subunit dehydrogenase-like oxidoreductase (DUF2520 family)
VAVLGYGQLGRALAGSLAKRPGHEVVVWTRSPVAQGRRAEEVAFVSGADATEAVRTAEVLFLALPDGAVRQVAERLAVLPVEWSGRVALHASGVHDANVLAALADRGAVVAVCHPLRAFPDIGRSGRARDAFAGALFLVEGAPGGVAAARALVSELGGACLEGRVTDAADYHLAATIASNYGLALREWARRRFEASGLAPADAVRAADALLGNALENARQAEAAGAALPVTGPLRRGDVETIRAHLSRLSGGELLAYAGLGLLLLGLASTQDASRVAAADPALAERIAAMLRAAAGDALRASGEREPPESPWRAGGTSGSAESPARRDTPLGRTGEGSPAEPAIRGGARS